jgi:hypothetical protein
MITKIYFEYIGTSHYDVNGVLINTTYHFVAYPAEQTDSIIGNNLNMRLSNQEGTKTKKMIENQITWAFEDYGRKVQSITFDDKYKGCEYNTLILSDFTCTIDYTY